MRDECNINNIVRKINSTGVIPPDQRQKLYADFSEPLTYQESLNVVLQANDQFANLPSHVRERFQNNPQKFLEFTADQNNLPEMVKLGLATQRETNQTKHETPEPPKTPKPKTPKPAENEE